MSTKSPYGPKIKAARVRLGKTVNAFASLLQVSRATQLNYEAGITIPTIAYLDRCLTLGVTASEMLVAIQSPTEEYRNLDFLLRSCPVELHEIVERHKGTLQAGGTTVPLYEELWTLFRRGFGCPCEEPTIDPAIRHSHEGAHISVAANSRSNI